MTEIYLDNGATTKPSELCKEKIIELLEKKYGNPSSLHEKGFEAEQELEQARNIIASSIKANAEEIYFTSGGTEANNIAVFGSVKAKKKQGTKIVTTEIEHSSVYNSIKELEKDGYEVIYLKPNKDGNITESQLRESIDEKTILVSVMMVNNETGTILPVDKIKDIIKQKKSPALLHIDAVQAYSKIPIRVDKLGVDLLSISGHKVHGPKGIGALYKKKGINIIPLTYGGEQQKKIRPGTEPVPLICGFGAAVEEFKVKENFDKVTKLNKYLRAQIKDIEGIRINSEENSLPYIINISTNKIKSETMLHYLSSMGIYVSSGSACAKGQKSRVLKAMNLPEKSIDTAIRISFSKYNTIEEIDKFIYGIKSGISKLAHI